MKSRLNQSNTRFALPLLRWAVPEMVGFCTLIARGAAALWYRVPSSPMPWSTLQQPHNRQPAAPRQAILGERVDRVLTTRRTEPACGQPHWRDRVAIQLDQKYRTTHNR